MRTCVRQVKVIKKTNKNIYLFFGVGAGVGPQFFNHQVITLISKYGQLCFYCRCDKIVLLQQLFSALCCVSSCLPPLPIDSWGKHITGLAEKVTSHIGRDRQPEEYQDTARGLVEDTLKITIDLT